MNTIFDRPDRENEYEESSMIGKDSSTQESTTINQGMRLVGEVDGVLGGKLARSLSLWP